MQSSRGALQFFRVHVHLKAKSFNSTIDMWPVDCHFIATVNMSFNYWTLTKVSALVVLQQLQPARCAGAAPTRNTRISNKALTASAGAAAVWWPAFVDTRLLYLGNSTEYTVLVCLCVQEKGEAFPCATAQFTENANSSSKLIERRQSLALCPAVDYCL